MLRKMKILVLTHHSLVPPAITEVAPSAKTVGEPEWATEHGVAETLRHLGHEVAFVGLKDKVEILRTSIWSFQPDILFNLTEEFDGVPHFDHNIVSLLELMRVSYTGCNPRGLMTARDKSLAKKILRYHSVPTPDFFVFPKRAPIELLPSFPFPLIVKSTIEEASMGIAQASVVFDRAQLKKRIRFIHENVGTDAIAEQYIRGRELYVGIIGNQRSETLPPWELDFGKLKESGEPIATHQVKWNSEYRRRHKIDSRKADLKPELKRKIETICSTAYEALGLSGYARMDLRLNEKGEVHLLEANPNCHIGREEDFAQSARAMGLPYPKLLEKILLLGKQWKPDQA